MAMQRTAGTDTSIFHSSSIALRQNHRLAGATRQQLGVPFDDPADAGAA